MAKERTSLSVRLAEVTQHVSEPVSHKVQVTNHLQLSSSADQSESHSIFLFISLVALFLSIHLFCTPPIHPLSPSSHAFLPIVSLNKMLYRLTSFLPSPFLSPSNLSALSLTFHFDFYLSDSPSSVSPSLWLCLWLLLSFSCVVSHRERSMLSFIFHCSGAWTLPHKHWHIFQQMQSCELLLSSPLKECFKIPLTQEERESSSVYILIYISDPRTIQRCLK